MYIAQLNYDMIHIASGGNDFKFEVYCVSLRDTVTNPDCSKMVTSELFSMVVY